MAVVARDTGDSENWHLSQWTLELDTDTGATDTGTDSAGASDTGTDSAGATYTGTDSVGATDTCTDSAGAADTGTNSVGATGCALGSALSPGTVHPNLLPPRARPHHGIGWRGGGAALIGRAACPSHGGRAGLVALEGTGHRTRAHTHAPQTRTRSHTQALIPPPARLP